jgi:hypothetical protein
VIIIVDMIYAMFFLSPVVPAGERKNGWMLDVVEPFLQPCDWGRSRVVSMESL